ncbi:unnamed protein product [Lupinus luteus]|uniref:K Homology domain-containing protein n=1 Tax=Lupinus luteus TaxID=3873 RepID=A0AAV1WNC9_LUPLU
MAGEDSDDGYIPEDPHFFPKFDFDDENDSDNFGFSNILHPDAADLVGEANPNENYFDGHHFGYLPKSPDFFIDINSDMETEVISNELRELLHPHEHDASTLVENAAKPNENHFDEHDVGYVPQEPISPQQIHTDQGITPFVFEFSRPEEHNDAATFIEDANLSENYSHEHDADTLIEGNMIGDFANFEQHAPENDSRGNRTAKWPGWPGQNIFRLLVPAKKVGCIIGPKGEYVKRISEETKARIKVLSGPPGVTERAVLISAREEPNCTVPPAVKGLLRVHEQVLNDIASIASGAMQRLNNNMIPSQPWGLPPPGVPANPVVAASGLDFASNHQYMPHFQHYGNYYHPATLPPNHFPQDPPPAHATDSSMEIHSSSVERKLSVETKETQYMQIPMSYADTVIGASGANISYIRSASGASITIRETKSMPGRMTVEISGTSSEIQTAELLVQLEKT